VAAKSDEQLQLWTIYGTGSDATDKTGGKLKMTEAIAKWGFPGAPHEGTPLKDLRWKKEFKSWREINCYIYNLSL